MSTILLVDDEPQILEILSSYLQKEGYHVLTAQTGKEAVEMATTISLTCIILDLMLPDLSGEEVCVQIRKESRVPILMLTAKSGEADRIRGLTIGADDYLIKPFSPRELVARVRAVMRRAGDYSTLSDFIEVGDLTISMNEKRVTKNGVALEVTPNEYRLLTTLVRYPGRTWGREELVREVMGFDFEGYDRTIDTHIKNLRQKIEVDPKQPEYIKTVYGLGYRFDDPMKK
ncbi:response regulator transcription factor [Brevibacillus sp. HB1.2]|uniref:DNA-binding response regulator n=1 Tax=Brevibacillus porteri TaxID=2126350 RepID=A0ABX5FVS2_9BACL|nr:MULTISPECIES: response regulator transcription factor [Brevibacillus]ATF13159.1 DNA-binding response regulator [Brevibacillus brevis X23]MED1916371.1 response regulator transcription factor [Bacillus thuringiensis]EJL22677.1 response regulator with CheY-like receiver domain and winged-helix DNA-binding domain [Brevibacillus sp. BC25]MDC0759699.1 response regulator transcription factor [Brevibacillus sp. AG]MED2132243.1 response regulator transcription factor [Brevibacillus porteri]